MRVIYSWAFGLFIIFISTGVHAHDAGHTYLSPACESLLATTALNRDQAESVLAGAAESQSLEFRVFTKSIAGQLKTVVLLGEHHISQARDLALARPVVSSFLVAATENGPTNRGRGYTYRVLPVASLLVLPKLMLEAAMPGNVRSSPMWLPKENPNLRALMNAEKGHEPSVSEELNILGLATLEASDFFCKTACVVFSAYAATDIKTHLVGLTLAGGYFLLSKFALMPSVRGAMSSMPLVKNRDRTMVKNILDYAENPKGENSWIVIVGRAHLENMGHFLSEEAGFHENVLDTL